MKKILAIALALVMMLAVSIPAFAADITADGGTGEAQIKTSTTKENGDEAAGFTVTIPAENIIPWETTDKAFTYTVTSHLAPAKAVSVSVADADDGYVMTDATGLELAYTLNNTASTMEGPIANAVECTYNVLVAAEDWAAAPVTEYADTLTFTASIVDA